MQVAVVKYNAGNIYSVMNALRRLGVEPLLTDDAERLRQADRVLFPGQGEALGAMNYLREHDGHCDLGDKSPAEDIAARFGVSKKVYKKAVGDLYRRRLINITESGITLTA